MILFRKFRLGILILPIVFSALISPLPALSQIDSFYHSDRLRLNVGEYFRLLKTDFVGQIKSPLQLPAHLPEATGFALFTYGLMRSDHTINDYSRKLTGRNPALVDISSTVTNFGGRYALYTMAALGATGVLSHDNKLINTTLLASQAYLTSGLWVAAMKYISGRERPSYIDPQGAFGTGAWHGPFYQYKKINGVRPEGAAYSSFPSGHSAAAFSIATTFAEMYSDKPVVVVISYTSASLVALSRLTEHKHWASDVFVASTLGYLSAKQVVRNFRKRSSTYKKKVQVDFSMGYSQGVVLPSVRLTFP